MEVGMDPIPWKRVRRALCHYARTHNVDSERVPGVIDTLTRLVGISGSFTRSRATARSIGVQLLRREVPHIVVPVCPAYTHQGRVYTYEGLGGGVPLLVRRHVPFLRKVQSILPGSRVTLLIADQEAGIPELCEAIGVTERVFAQRIRESIKATRRYVTSLGWSVDAMTRFVPGVIEDVPQVAAELCASERFRRCLLNETDRRAGIYARIGYPSDAHFRSTVRTAAQYVHFGRFAEIHRYIPVNHTTQNLAWYRRTGVGFLHNPVSVYDHDEQDELVLADVG